MKGEDVIKRFRVLKCCQISMLVFQHFSWVYTLTEQEHVVNKYITNKAFLSH